MDARDVRTKSSAIVERLIKTVSWQSIKSLHIYQPVKSLAEVDTGPLIVFLSDFWPEIRINIQSQSRHAAIPKQKFELIIVPCLGFDKSGNRLGWGEGWYDRFLASQPQALKIGLAYQNSLIKDGLPVEPHDIRLDKIITEEGILIKS